MLAVFGHLSRSEYVIDYFTLLISEKEIMLSIISAWVFAIFVLVFEGILISMSSFYERVRAFIWVKSLFLRLFSIRMGRIQFWNNL